MKVLYLASNSKDSSTLRIEQDITELQRTIAQVSGDPVTFIFLPALPFEEIEMQLALFKPDILHITAHGAPNELYLSNSAEMKVPLSAASLRAVLSAHKPELVYINACTSVEIAKSLHGYIPHTIGTTEPITNFAARKSAVTFYRYLLRGQSLEAAFQASSATVETLDRNVRTEIFSKVGRDPAREFFYSVPRLVACFEDHKFKNSNGYRFLIGMTGASETTMQIAFCTDDESFILDQDELESCLCSVVRTNAIRGEVWTEEIYEGIYGDFRLYALGITSAGRCYSIAGTLVKALIDFYQVHFDTTDTSKFPDDLKAAIQDLTDNDGSIVRPYRPVQAAKPAKRKPSETK